MAVKIGGSQSRIMTPSLAPTGARHSSCKSFTVRTGGGPFSTMGGRVALDRAEALLQGSESGAGLPRSLVAAHPGEV